MENQMQVEKSPYGFWAKFAVISLIIIQFSQALASPALASIQATFSNVDTTLIQQIIALPTLLMIVSSLFCGQICARIGYRKTSYIAIALALLGGVMPAIMNGSIPVILFWRALFGLGYGLVFSLCIAAIGALWKGREQTTMYGVMTGVGALCAMGYSTAAGILAAMDWRYVFWAYLIIIPFALVIIAKLPEPPKEEVAKTASKEAKTGKLGSAIVIFAILAALSVAFTTSFMTNVAMVIMGTGMGQPQDIGFTMTLFSLGMAIGAFIYSLLKKFTKRFILAILFILFGACMAFMSNTTSLAMFTAAATVYGALFGIVNPEYEKISVNLVAHPSRCADGASLFVALQGVGQFVGPFLCAGIAAIFGLAGVYYQWAIAWPIMLVGGIILFIVALINKKDLAEERWHH